MKDKANLKQSLSLLDATAISIGAIIGAGIFVVTGIAAGLAGSALVISMLIAAVVALFTMLSFAELTAWQPLEGSVYEYTRLLVSPFTGFLAGWMWILSNTFIGATVALGFAYYLIAIFPTLPSNIVAAIICLAFTIFNFLGARQSALLNNILVAAKLIILGFFIVFGTIHAEASNFLPFIPFSTGTLSGAYFVFFAYSGFARAAVVSEEVKDAKTNVPKALFLSLTISTIVYVLVGIAAVGLIGSSELAASNSPLTQAIAITGNPLAIQIVTLGGLLATASVLLTSILGVSRMTYAMSRNKDLPKTLSTISQKFSTPAHSIWIIGAIMTLLALFVDLTQVVAISTFSTLFYYALANIAALKLKVDKRRYPRVFPILGLTTCLILLISLFLVSIQSWIISALCLSAGAIYYFAKQKLNKRKG